MNIHALSIVTIKHDTEARQHKVSGIYDTPSGKVATLAVKKWGQTWVARVPFEDLEVVEDEQ